MSKDKALAFLKEHSPVVFSALQAGKYIQFDVLTFELWKEGYKMPYTAHYNVLHSPQGLILEVLPPCEAERIKAYRIATAEQLISDYLEQRKAAFEALRYAAAQATEREAVERVLTDPKALLIQAPAGDIAPQHTTPEHKPPGNYITQAYKQLTPDNYFREIHAEALSPITSYPFLMAEALRRYAAWIDSKTQVEAVQSSAKVEGEQLTTWEQCMYYRYLFESGAPTPFDGDRPKSEAYNELAERHGGSAAHWKNTFLQTERNNRKHERKRKEGLKKVLKLLKQYPDAYRICELEMREAGIL